MKRFYILATCLLFFSGCLPATETTDLHEANLLARPAIPPIDAAAPARTATATLALG